MADHESFAVISPSSEEAVIWQYFVDGYKYNDSYTQVFKISPWDKFDIGSITKAAENNGIEKTRGGITKFTRRCSRSNCCKSVFKCCAYIPHQVFRGIICADQPHT